MTKNLFIVESPAKVRTLKKYLSSEFEIKASVGHLVDLPSSRLGVDIAQNFMPEYTVIKGKEAIIQGFIKAATKAKKIYLAQDPDREGEAIAWHIAEQLGGKPERFYRVLLYELTENAIAKAIVNPTRLNHNLYNSQQARRILDRLVGYQISPLLWDKVKRGLSAGRVQSVALRLVVDREKTINSFISEEYWSIIAELSVDQSSQFLAKLTSLNGVQFSTKNRADALVVVELTKKQKFYVEKIVTYKRKQFPLPPFITSTLQQEASRKLDFSPKETMSIAQRLYEGQELDGGDRVGLITYMRTDSTRLADEAIIQVRKFIAYRFGLNYLPARPYYYKAKVHAQEGHEAIRPTDIFRTPESLVPYLKKKDLNLYHLIYSRFLACQMANAILDQVVVTIVAGPALFKASGQMLKFSGFKVVYADNCDCSINFNKTNSKAKNNEKEFYSREIRLPLLAEGQLLAHRIIPKQHFTKPPLRFTEATLVKELEQKGIGRPSTYASILSTIQNKKYVIMVKDKEISRSRYYLFPTSLGIILTDLLIDNFPQIMQVDFTAKLEKALDLVEKGRKDWQILLKKFHKSFTKSLEFAQKNMLKIKGQGIPTKIQCPNCNEFMSIHLGKHGEFLSCNAFFQCKTTRDFTRDDKGNLLVNEPLVELVNNTTCEKCNAPMLIKNGPHGNFFACTAYPKCKNVKSLNRNTNNTVVSNFLAEECPDCRSSLVVKFTRANGRFIACSDYPQCHYSRGIPIGVVCPNCSSNLVEKTSRKGKLFFGCENYPSCNFAVWNRPLNESCPQCAYPFLIEKNIRQDRKISCPAKSCKYYR